MKLMHFLGEDNNIYYGEVETQDDRLARVLKGDIFGEFGIAGWKTDIKEFLPVVTPPNIIGIGLNYAKHASETGIRLPERPIMFLKGTNSICGHETPIILPKAGPDEVDYEAELAVIIGKETRNVTEAEAEEYILGYCCGNDISARDWQIKKQKMQWSRGKSFDTFCPLGPYIVTKDEVPDPNNLKIELLINGVTFQESNTSDMIFNVQQLVSELSQSMTLLPGTVIMTGTPEGVGFTRKPPVFLKEGDRVTVKIEKLGSLSNPVRRGK
ncbi:MAG: fumarylacetoacetate hydrolase family protein [bacterium]|nr:fumarylacetoacetate hydrolase family protein [bacterium]